MSSKRLKGCHTDTLWNILVGAVLFVCMYITYQFLLFKGFICLDQSECLEQSNPITEQLIQEECSSFCNTKECTDISQHILKSMNQSADPCENFDNFACGMYHEKFTDGENHWILMDDQTQELYLKVKEVLEDISTSTSTEDFSALYKLKLVFESCMNKRSDIDSVSSIQQFLSSVGIVHEGSRNNSSYSLHSFPLSEVLGKLSAYGEKMFFHLKKKDKKGDFYELKVVSPARILDSVYVYQSRSMNTLEKRMKYILQHFLVDDDEIRKTMKNFKDVYRFLHYNLCHDDGNKNPDKLKCAEEEREHLVCQLAESYVRTANLSSFYSTDEITIGCSRDKVEKIVDFIRNTDDRVIANYIAVNLILKNLVSMGSFFRRKSFKIQKNFEIEIKELIYKSEKHEKQFCVDWIMQNMKFPLGGAFVSRYWPTKATNEIKEIYQDYVREIKSSVMNQNWITEKTKRNLSQALEKSQNCMEGLIQEMRNESFINSLYETFHPSSSSFMVNVFDHNKFINTAEEIYDRKYFNRYLIDDAFNSLLNPFSTNAFGLEDIYLSFGMLSSPVYHLGYPRVFNLAKIGEIIGHEIGHIITIFIKRLGRADEIQQNWEKKKECIIKQYSNFKLKHNDSIFTRDESTEYEEFLDSIGEASTEKKRAERTVDEDISDSIGLASTENVSKPYLTEMGSKDFMLPGLSYSPEQLLYISYEQAFCSVRTPEFEREMSRGDKHSQPDHRIIGTLQNSEKFAKAFNCPSTTYMNPIEKCSVFE